MRKSAFAIATTFVLAGTLFVAVRADNETKPWDTAAAYKGKCVACHGPKAEKKFNNTLPDDQLIDAILKGKKAEKPPNMPAYGTKGVTAEHAKNLVDYMKQLKSGQ